MQGLRPDHSRPFATFQNGMLICHLVMLDDVLLVLLVGAACALASVFAFLQKVQRQFIVVEVGVRVVVTW